MALGKLGENFASQYLVRSLGWKLCCTNWRCPSGEVDIVALDYPWLVIVEVKTRSSNAYGSPVESVHPRKVLRLRRVAASLLHTLPAHVSAVSRVRFDVLGIIVRNQKVVQLRHIRHAVEAV